jgi:hypothetical protein
MYKTCSHCSKLRQEGKLDLALHCNRCKGKGIIRKSEAYICNNCGGTLCLPLTGNSHKYPHGLIDAKISGGYESTYLTDMTTYEFSLCEKCLRVMFESFKIKPDVNDADGFSDYSYEKDLEWHKYVMWRDAGGQKEKFDKGICNKSEKCTNFAKWRFFFDGYLSIDTFCDECKEAEMDVYKDAIQPRDPVLLSELNNIPFYRSYEEIKTKSDLERIAFVYIDAMVKKYKSADNYIGLLYWKFLPQAIGEMLEGKKYEDGISLIFDSSSNLIVPAEKGNMLFAGGTLHWGKGLKQTPEMVEVK